jgi:hypothetical protein
MWDFAVSGGDARVVPASGEDGFSRLVFTLCRGPFRLSSYRFAVLNCGSSESCAGPQRSGGGLTSAPSETTVEDDTGEGPGGGE